MAFRGQSGDAEQSFNFTDVLKRLSLANDNLITFSPVAQAILRSEEANSGSPAQIQDVSLDSSGSSSIPFSLGLRSPGKVSPLRGRTMKEYEEQLGSLKKENFSLKLRIYFLEERMGQKYDKEDKEELYKTNIELKVETEALKRELYDKQELVRQASTALSGLEQQFQEQVAQMKGIHEQEKQQLNEKIGQLQKDLDDYDQRIQEEGGRQGELTKLCGLAFSTGAEEEEPAEPVPSREKLSLPLNLQGHNNSSFGHSPVQGLFSLPATVPSTLGKIQSPNKPGELSEDPDLMAEQKVAALEARVVELEERVTELEGELAAKEETNSVLEGDIANLRKELEDKVEKIADLEVEVSEKDMKIDDVMQELETRHVEIQAKEDQIEALHQDLIKVEPEIEVKVQEIVERDRIIEEKIEQIEQQNKILVEIQITLDEKQKQIADMEQKISEYSAKITKLNEELDKACKTIQTFAEEVEARDKEIVTLKKELKRKEKKIKDLVAELKEALDMLNKAKWEAETSGGEDGVKEMAEEENEVNNFSCSIESSAAYSADVEEEFGSLEESYLVNDNLHAWKALQHEPLQYNLSPFKPPTQTPGTPVGYETYSITPNKCAVLPVRAFPNQPELMTPENGGMLKRCPLALHKNLRSQLLHATYDLS